MKTHFRNDKSGQKFLDSTRKSCTEFIADVARTQFGFDDEPIKSLFIGRTLLTAPFMNRRRSVWS